MSFSHFCSRRSFFKKGAAAGISTPTLSTLLNLNLASHAVASEGLGEDDRKTIVVINFAGGMDSYQLLVPTDTPRYATYASSRGNLATPRENLLPLTLANGGSEEYGLHPSAPELADLFNGTGNFTGTPCLSFVANIGTLVEPITREQFLDPNRSVDIPRNVASHNSQAEQWQTTLPQGADNLRGWLGRSADLLNSSANVTNSAMNLSLAGDNLAQLGSNVSPLSFTSSAPLGLGGVEFATDQNHPLSVKNLMHRRLLKAGQGEHRTLVDRAFADISINSLDQQLALKNSFESFPETDIPFEFPANAIGRQLKEAYILIRTRPDQGLNRQTIYVNSPGWDDHSGLLVNYPRRLAELSQAIGIFQRNLNASNLQQSVVTLTTSEFARTLRSNGNGSDHAWGGPQFIFGGPVDGGSVFGRFPDQQLRGPDSIGRGGQLLPERSCDEYFAEVLLWFGVAENRLNTVLPNYDHFADRQPLAYLNY